MIDTHCHLDLLSFKNDLDDVIQSAKDKGVDTFIIPGADPVTLKRAINICDKYDGVYFSIGTHPQDIDSHEEDNFSIYAQNKKCVAIGECGLDYYRLSNSFQKRNAINNQKSLMQRHIDIAFKYNKPLIFHVREAAKDFKNIILDNCVKRKIRGVLHCYSGQEELLELADFGFYFGIGGLVTFKNVQVLRNILPIMPLQNIILETDAPYLSPHPHRGIRNEPKYIPFIVSKISEVLGVSEDRIRDITTQNALKLFSGIAA